MSRRSYALAILCSVLISGCGGNKSITYSSTPLFYRGTITFTDQNPLGHGSADAIANIFPGSGFSAITSSPSFIANVAKFSVTPSAVMEINGAYLSGTIQELAQGNTFAFSFSNGAKVLATGEFRKSALPTLGSTFSAPPAGSYNGEDLVVGNGSVRAAATMTATVQSNNQFVAISSISDSEEDLFEGTFNSDGTISGPVLIVNGCVIIPSITPAYSYDGATLIIKWDGLTLSPGVTWMTLKK